MRRSFTGAAAALLIAAASIAQAAEVVTSSNLPIAQTIVTLTAGVDTTLGSGTVRRYLCVMNIGTGLVSLGFDQAAVSGSGWALEPAAIDGHQGGSMCWESSVVVGSVVHAVSAAGSIVAVLEGR